MAIRLNPYRSQISTPTVSVSGGNIRAPDLSAPYDELQRSASVLSDSITRAIVRRDELDLMDYERQLGQVDTELLIGSDDTPGALYQKGRSAEDVRARTLKAWDERVTKLEPKLRTEEGRRRAQAMRMTRRQDTDVRLTKHEFDEGLSADREATEASLLGYQNEAIANADDPAMVDASIARAAGTRAAFGRRTGESPEATAVAIATQESATVKQVVALQLSRDPTKALETFKRNSSRLLGQDRLSVEQALQPYVMDVQSRSVGDSLWSGGDPAVAVGSSSVYDAIALTESNNRQFDDAGNVIRGPKTATGERAVGAFQIMPATGPEAARLAGEKWDPKRLEQDADYNARLGRAYIDAQIKRFGGNIPAVAAAYNMGPAAAEAWMEGRPYQTASGKRWAPSRPMDPAAMPEETRNYITKVTKRMGGTAKPVATTLDVAEREVAAIRRADQIQDPRLRNDAINRIQFLAANERKLIQERERSSELGKAELRNQYGNVVAKLADGVDVPILQRPTEAQLTTTFGAADGKRMYDEMNIVSRMSPTVSQLKTATTAEAVDILAQFKPKADSQNYAFEKQVYDGMQQAYVAAQKQRNDDPVTFLLSNSKAVTDQYAGVQQAQQEFLEAEPEDRATAAQKLSQKGQAYASFMMSEQARLGVPAKDRALLPKATVAALNDQFQSLLKEGKTADAVNLVRTTVASFGDGAALAIQQLGKDTGPVTRMALEGIDTRTIESFVAANAEGDSLKKAIGNDAWKEVDDTVREQLADLDATGTSEWDDYYDITLKVAATKVRGGMDPKRAAVQAAAETINGRYVFAGSGQTTYRVPLATPQGNPIDAEGVVRAAQSRLDTLTPDAIGLSDAVPPGINVDDYKQYRVQRIQKTGQWRTLGDESGLTLTYQDDNGRLVQVRRPDGSPYSMTWADLLSSPGADDEPAEVAAFRATLRGMR